jgi:hypothetical protein
VKTRLQETFYRVTGRTELAEALVAERQMVAHLQESIGDLEQRLFEPGWQRMLAFADMEFTRDGLRQMAAICRLFAIKNPLIKRGLGLRQAYVWGGGVTVRAGTTKQRPGLVSRSQQDVNQVVQDFLDANEATFSGPTARQRHELSLGTDGSVFFALFTKPRTGQVQVRVLPFDEITEIITDPQDRSRRWFYKRTWTEAIFNPQTGTQTPEMRVTYYPDVTYRPKRRLPQIGGARVNWDAPVAHVSVNRPEGWLFGIPDAYAAVDWAHAYKEFLEDWAKLVKALSRFAWRATSKAGKQATIRSKLAGLPTRDPVTNEALDVGATALMDPSTMLEPISKSGAVTVDAESGRPLAMMVAAALGVPVTMLLSDPGQTGARAVAETLDQPTELEMQARRDVWAEAYRVIIAYVIDAAARAPQGTLKGSVVRDGDTETVALTGDTDRTVEVSWPDLDDIDVEKVVKAIALADQVGYLPPLVIVRLLLIALGVDDVDAVLDEVTDDEGNFVPPDVSAGQVAVDAFNRGDNPAAALNGGQDSGATAPPEDSTEET